MQLFSDALNLMGSYGYLIWIIIQGTQITTLIHRGVLYQQLKNPYPSYSISQYIAELNIYSIIELMFLYHFIYYFEKECFST
jgi:hypothetical protein